MASLLTLVIVAVVLLAMMVKIIPEKERMPPATWSGISRTRPGNTWPG
jgi:hypothetical protein